VLKGSTPLEFHRWTTAVGRGSRDFEFSDRWRVQPRISPALAIWRRRPSGGCFKCRRHRQHLLHHHLDRLQRPVRLGRVQGRVQGRGRRLHPFAGPRSRQARHHRERDRPGFVDTELTKSLDDDGRRIAGRSALRRLPEAAEGAPIRLAAEIARVVDDGQNLHVLPIVTRGATENVNSLLHLRGIDAAIINSDALEEYKSQVPDIQQRLAYILNLFPSELHIFVRPEMQRSERSRRQEGRCRLHKRLTDAESDGSN
jgi:hypothetical protein